MTAPASPPAASSCYSLPLLPRRRALGYSPRAAAATVLLQLAYTTLFGSIASAVFLSSRSFLATALVHTFCNWQGLPDVARALAWPILPQRAVLLAAYAAGPLAFVVLLGKLVPI